MGPVEVLEAVGKHAFKVKLPPLVLNHPVFHVPELEPYRQSTIEGHHQPPPPPVEIKGEKNYVVESIGKSRENKRRMRVEYLVFWEGYPPEEATWEPGESLVGTAEEALQELHRRYPKQPRDSRVKARNCLFFPSRFSLEFSSKVFRLFLLFSGPTFFPLGFLTVFCLCILHLD